MGGVRQFMRITAAAATSDRERVGTSKEGREFCEWCRPRITPRRPYGAKGCACSLHAYLHLEQRQGGGEEALSIPLPSSPRAIARTRLPEARPRIRRTPVHSAAVLRTQSSPQKNGLAPIAWPVRAASSRLSPERPSTYPSAPCAASSSVAFPRTPPNQERQKILSFFVAPIEGPLIYCS